MTDTNATPHKKRWWHLPPQMFGLARGTFLILAGTILILLSVGGAAGASKLEEDDQFCTNCHVASERTYYNRSRIAQDNRDLAVPDLASFHYVAALDSVSYDEFRCVDCHRGRQTILDRGTALVLGAYDGFIYATGGGSATEIERGEVHQPSIINSSCVECHTDTLLVLGFDNHFHNHLPEAETAHDRTGDLFVPEGLSFEDEQSLLDEGLVTVETEADCLTCHLAHVSIVGGERVQFLDEETKLQGCTECHEDNDLNIDLLEDGGSTEETTESEA